MIGLKRFDIKLTAGSRSVGRLQVLCVWVYPFTLFIVYAPRRRWSISIMRYRRGE